MTSTDKTLLIIFFSIVVGIGSLYLVKLAWIMGRPRRKIKAYGVSLYDGTGMIIRADDVDIDLYNGIAMFNFLEKGATVAWYRFEDVKAAVSYDHYHEIGSPGPQPVRRIK